MSDIGIPDITAPFWGGVPTYGEYGGEGHSGEQRNSDGTVYHDPSYYKRR